MFLRLFIKKEVVVERKHQFYVPVNQKQLNEKEYSLEWLKRIFCGKNCVNIKKDHRNGKA